MYIEIKDIPRQLSQLHDDSNTQFHDDSNISILKHLPSMS